ncbi:MAG: 16S rRNA processing protein RimM [Oscillospiraceae bacterium]|nr:16S rRNA processing protein RimM [Oscillospiraceae bacterium]
MIKSYLELGKIVGTHGIRGELKLDPWCDDPDFAKNFSTVYFGKNGEDPVKIASCRKHKNQILFTLEGYNDINSAETLRNKIIYIKRSDIKLSDGVWFIEELMGCKAINADDNNIVYGSITDIFQTGANDVWQITDENGNNFLLPAIKDVVIDADVENCRAYIRPLKGIFDDAN